MGFTDRVPTRQNNAVSGRAHSGVGPSAILNTLPILDSQTTYQHAGGAAIATRRAFPNDHESFSCRPPAPLEVTRMTTLYYVGKKGETFPEHVWMVTGAPEIASRYASEMDGQVYSREVPAATVKMP